MTDATIKTATGLQAVYGTGVPGEYIGSELLQGVSTPNNSNPTGSFWLKEDGMTLFQPENSTKVFELPPADIMPLYN